VSLGSQNERLWNTAGSDFTPSPSQVRFAPTTPADGGLYGNWNLLGGPRFEDFDAPLLASAATLSSYKASAEKGVSGFTNTAMVTLPEMHEGGASSPSEGPGIAGRQTWHFNHIGSNLNHIHSNLSSGWFLRWR
jgi:hypothetical protein